MTSVKVIVRKTKGGGGSGNWGHSGRPGMIGGSMPGKGGGSAPSITSTGSKPEVVVYYTGEMKASRPNTVEISKDAWRAWRIDRYDGNMRQLWTVNKISPNDVTSARDLAKHQSHIDSAIASITDRGGHMFGMRLRAEKMEYGWAISDYDWGKFTFDVDENGASPVRNLK